MSSDPFRIKLPPTVLRILIENWHDNGQYFHLSPDEAHDWIDEMDVAEDIVHHWDEGGFKIPFGDLIRILSKTDQEPTWADVEPLVNALHLARQGARSSEISEQISAAIRLIEDDYHPSGKRNSS